MVQDFCGFFQPSEWETYASRDFTCVYKYLVEKVKETSQAFLSGAQWQDEK